MRRETRTTSLPEVASQLEEVEEEGELKHWAVEVVVVGGTLDLGIHGLLRDHRRLSRAPRQSHLFPHRTGPFLFLLYRTHHALRNDRPVLPQDLERHENVVAVAGIRC